MHFLHIHQRRYAQFERLRHETGLVHAFSTRPANVGPRNNPHGAAERQAMAADLELNAERLCYCEQVHDTKLTIVDADMTAGALPHCDGAATALPGLPLMTFSADCPLILAYDPVRGVVGLAHASWRCTVAQATARLLELMTSQFGCQASDVRAGIGPGAGPCCYEVGRDVYEAARGLADRDSFFERRNGRLYFNLWEANRAQLLTAGVRPEKIETAGICTLCHNEVFFSYRREGPGCGHFGLMAAIVRD
ncbi:MAG: laccase domain-containing protein [Phycisphaerae bacterium]|nr:laccase domain-containing protein [Phycisphaerae bacterium]